MHRRGLISAGLFLLFSCGGPVPYTEAESVTAVKADTIYYGNGDWVAGKDLYLVQKQEPDVQTWPYWLALAGILLFSCVGILAMRKIYKRQILRREADESEAVLTLVKDRISLIHTLTKVHEKTARQNQALSYPDELESLQELVNSYHAYLDELRKDKSFLTDLEAALNVAKDNVMQNVRHLLGDSVSEEDYTVLLCYLAGMNPASISFVTGIKPGTVRVKKSRLIDKIGLLPQNDREAIISCLQSRV